MQVESAATTDRIFRYRWEQTYLAKLLQCFDTSGINFIYTDCAGWNGWAWNSTYDAFYILSDRQKELLRHNKHTYFIFDFSKEGYPIYMLLDIIYHNCKKYNVPANKVIFITSNLSAYDEYTQYQHPEKQQVKICSSLRYKHVSTQILNDYNYPQFSTVDELLIHHQTRVREKYSKYFISLSRNNNRPWRSALQLILSTDNYLSSRGIMSHDHNIEDHNIDIIKTALADCDRQKLPNWLDSLPIIADTTDFTKQWSYILTPDIYSSGAFWISGETNFANNLIFYTEKTFKPMLMMQPVIIYGAANMNKILAEIGFKTYDEWFDYSFDSEADPHKRLYLFKKEITRVCKLLDSKSREEQIQWRFKNTNTIMHNYQACFSVTAYEQDKITKLISTLRKEINQ